MKTRVIIFFALLSGISCFGQEIEFCSSLNTSSEQRFQSAYGIGLQYQHDIGSKFKAGLGMHYNFNHSQFDYIPYVDGNPNLIIADKINSYSQRLSIRLNIQGSLMNKECVSISLGPEISYNYLWGKDQIDERVGQSSNNYIYSQNIKLAKDVGFGLISKIEVRNFMAPALSLCFTIRPELLIGKDLFSKGGRPIFSGGLGFTEFQIGLNYRFQK